MIPPCGRFCRTYSWLGIVVFVLRDVAADLVPVLVIESERFVHVPAAQHRVGAAHPIDFLVKLPGDYDRAHGYTGSGHRGLTPEHERVTDDVASRLGLTERHEHPSCIGPFGPARPHGHRGIVLPAPRQEQPADGAPAGRGAAGGQRQGRRAARQVAVEDYGNAGFWTVSSAIVVCLRGAAG